MREGGGVPFERMDHAQLIQGFSDQTKVADAQVNTFLKHFCLLVLVLVVAD